jgi:hypothetical protein
MSSPAFTLTDKFFLGGIAVFAAISRYRRKRKKQMVGTRCGGAIPELQQDVPVLIFAPKLKTKSKRR